MGLPRPSLRRLIHLVSISSPPPDVPAWAFLIKAKDREGEATSASSEGKLHRKKPRVFSGKGGGRCCVRLGSELLVYIVEQPE